MSDASSILPDAAETIEVSVQSVVSWIDLPEDQRPRLIDCREREELDLCKIEGCEWLPLGEFPFSLAKLTQNTDRGIVVYCHHGMRSLQAAAFLRQHGVDKVFSMAGGIEQWACQVDPDMARY